MASKVNTVEGISNGTTITNVNSGGASGDAWQSTISASANLVSDNTHAAHGTQSAKFMTVTLQTTDMTWTLTASPTWYFRVYFWVDSITAATNPSIMRFRGTTDTVQCMRVTFDDTRHLQLRNTANTVISTMTAQFTFSQWNRVEGFCTPGNGTTTGAGEIKLFVGDSSTPVTNGTLSTTGQNMGSVTNIDACSFGQVVNYNLLPNEWMDDFAVSNVNYIGPVITTLSPSSIASAGSVPTPTITPGSVTLQHIGIASTEAFPTPTITAGQVTVSPASIGSAEAFGTPSIAAGAVTLHPPSISSAEVFGTPSITASSVTLSPPSIGSSESVPTPTLTAGSVTISPASIPSSEAFGTPTITATTVPVLSPPSIPSDEAFGTPAITASPVTLSVASIASQEAFGSATIFEPGGTITLFPPSIGSEEAFGPVIVARISPPRGSCCTGEEFRAACCPDSIPVMEEEMV